jgi:hypothetical protein
LLRLLTFPAVGPVFTTGPCVLFGLGISSSLLSVVSFGARVIYKISAHVSRENARGISAGFFPAFSLKRRTRRGPAGFGQPRRNIHMKNVPAVALFI